MNQKQKHLGIIVLFCFVSLVTAQQTLQEEQDFRFAIQLENKELFDIAAVQFERFSESYPSSPQAPTALFRAGENYEKADSLTKASNAYRTILLRYPQSLIMDRAQYNQAKLLSMI